MNLRGGVGADGAGPGLSPASTNASAMVSEDTASATEAGGSRAPASPHRAPPRAKARHNPAPDPGRHAAAHFRERPRTPPAQAPLLRMLGGAPGASASGAGRSFPAGLTLQPVGCLSCTWLARVWSPEPFQFHPTFFLLHNRAVLFMHAYACLLSIFFCLRTKPFGGRSNSRAERCLPCKRLTGDCIPATQRVP